MTEKVYKLFLLLNLSDFSLFFYIKLQRVSFGSSQRLKKGETLQLSWMKVIKWIL